MTQEKAKRLMLQLLSRMIDEASEAKQVLREKHFGADTEKAISKVSELADALEDLLSLTRWGKKTNA